MSFDKAYDDTMGYEGGYAFDPDDRGGETYKGISRRYHPNWSGWRIVDSYKPFNGKDYSEIYADEILDDLVKKFYKDEFWDHPGFGQVDKISEMLAEKLFDTGVNVGYGRASKWLQSSLNLLNRNGKYYPDIAVDGGLGPISLQTLQKAMESNPIDRILTVFVVHQGEHYKKIMENDKSQEKYVGWFDRLTYK